MAKSQSHKSFKFDSFYSNQESREFKIEKSLNLAPKQNNLKPPPASSSSSHKIFSKIFSTSTFLLSNPRGFSNCSSFPLLRIKKTYSR